MQLEQSTYERICYPLPALIRCVHFSANISVNAYCSTRPAMRGSWHRLTHTLYIRDYQRPKLSSSSRTEFLGLGLLLPRHGEFQALFG